MVKDTGLLHATLPKKYCNSVPTFEAAGAPTGTGTRLFMVARPGRCICNLCSGLIRSRLSKIYTFKNKNGRYVLKCRSSFQCYPLGAPIVNGEDKVVAVVTYFVHETHQIHMTSIDVVREKIRREDEENARSE
jgi:hypothetical protein